MIGKSLEGLLGATQGLLKCYQRVAEGTAWGLPKDYLMAFLGSIVSYLTVTLVSPTLSLMATLG